ncbi:MAG: peptidylprolyl isomerase [Gammaproteobacteria bacterium]|nr:MAG: peptidylprolyl isomerase [Gammaproteobacteria bacterium]PIE37943.1 MAG: peptidylprolyl isomerase [Gammaproteobacteria bacterium]
MNRDMQGRECLRGTGTLQAAARLAALVLTSIALVACGSSGNRHSWIDGESSARSSTVASVNGRPISATLVERVTRQLEESGKDDDRTRVVDELVNLELLAQHAEWIDLDKQPNIAASLRLQRMQTLANAYLAHKSEVITFSEEDLMAEYERQRAATDNAEYRASHILLESRDAAEAVRQRLENGEDFAQLAASESTDPSSVSGGDLGWFRAGSMNPEIIEAVKPLAPGERVDDIIETEFGFHLVLLTDKRDRPLPAFEEVREQLRESALRNALAEHVEALRDRASITVVD